MPIRTIYCDESGFTGYNLLDPSQPIFAIASAQILEEQAEQILVDSFPRYQGAEFKFSNIWSSGNRSGLLKFVSHLEALQREAFVYVIDKRFGVLTKIVDFLIEPYITDAGFDFYGDGFCWKYCNYIHFGLTQLAPPELLESLLANYQAFAREPTRDGLRKLTRQLKSAAKKSPKKVRVFLEQMELGARLFEKYHDLEKFRTSNELQVTTMLSLVTHWRQNYTEDFAIVHDASSNFMRNRDVWERVTNNDVPRQQHRLGDGTYVEYPLRVVSTTAMNSKDSRSIQFCDVLAGIVTRHFNPQTEERDRQFMDELIDAGLQHLTYNGIRPALIFPDEIPPKRLTGPDVVDQMTGIIFGPHNDNR